MRNILICIVLLSSWQSFAQYKITKMHEGIARSEIKTNITPINDSVGVVKSNLIFYYFNLSSLDYLGSIDFKNRVVDFFGIYGGEYWIMIYGEVVKKNKKEIKRACREIKKNKFTPDKANAFFAKINTTKYN